MDMTFYRKKFQMCFHERKYILIQMSWDFVTEDPIGIKSTLVKKSYICYSYAVWNIFCYVTPCYKQDLYVCKNTDLFTPLFIYASMAPYGGIENEIEWILQFAKESSKSTLVQTKAWCHHAPRSMLPYGIISPQWHNVNLANICFLTSSTPSSPVAPFINMV